LNQKSQKSRCVKLRRRRCAKFAKRHPSCTCMRLAGRLPSSGSLLAGSVCTNILRTEIRATKPAAWRRRTKARRKRVPGRARHQHGRDRHTRHDHAPAEPDRRLRSRPQHQRLGIDLKRGRGRIDRRGLFGAHDAIAAACAAGATCPSCVMRTTTGCLVPRRSSAASKIRSTT